MKGWIGVDLDGTLAHYEHWRGPEHIGAPIPRMVERVKGWLKEGKDVRIFTARVWPLGTIDQDLVENLENKRVYEAIVARETVEKWCTQVFGQKLPITCTKDFGMVELWDDRAVSVIPNTGMSIHEAVGLER